MQFDNPITTLALIGVALAVVGLILTATSTPGTTRRRVAMWTVVGALTIASGVLIGNVIVNTIGVPHPLFWVPAVLFVLLPLGLIVQGIGLAQTRITELHDETAFGQMTRFTAQVSLACVMSAGIILVDATTLELAPHEPARLVWVTGAMAVLILAAAVPPFIFAVVIAARKRSATRRPWLSDEQLTPLINQNDLGTFTDRRSVIRFLAGTALIIGLLAGICLTAAVLLPAFRDAVPSWLAPTFFVITIYLTPAAVIALTNATFYVSRLEDTRTAAISPAQRETLLQRFEQSLFPGPTHPAKINKPHRALRIDVDGTASLEVPRDGLLATLPATPADTDLSPQPTPPIGTPAEREALEELLLRQLYFARARSYTSPDLNTDAFLAPDNSVYLLPATSRGYTDFPTDRARPLINPKT